MTMDTKVQAQTINTDAAAQNIASVVLHTPLQYNQHLSIEYEAEVYLKREDLQTVRSYKLRGAFNKISSLSQADRDKGVVCASAGNHAQGVAFSCKNLHIKGKIFMPVPTPRQKISQTEMWGHGMVETILRGDTYDDCQEAAIAYAEEHNMTYIPPFDDLKIIESKSTVAKEIYEDLTDVDSVLIPIVRERTSGEVWRYLNNNKSEAQIP